MTAAEIRSKYLELYRFDLRDPVLRQELVALAKKAKTAKLPVWHTIITARIARCDGDDQTAINLVDQALAQEPENLFAILLKGCVLPQERGAESLALYESVCQKARNAVEPGDLQLLAIALINKGVTLRQARKLNAALAVYDEVVKRFGNATTLALREQVAKALVSKAITLGTMHEFAAEVAAYDEVVKRFGNATELPLREQVGRALFNKGVALGQMQQPDVEVTAYDEVVRRFGNATELPLREQVGRALFNKGVALGQMQQPKAEVAAYDEVMRHFGDATELSLREQVAKALVNKGAALGQMQKPEAVAAFDEVIERFGDATELPLREQVAKALVNKGIALGRIQKPEAVAAFDEVIKRFGDATEPPLREQVIWALLGIAVILHKQGHIAEAVEYCDRAAKLADRSTEKGKELDGRAKSLKALFLSSKRDTKSKRAKSGVLRATSEALRAKSEALSATRNSYNENLQVYLDYVLARFPKEKREIFFRQMKARKERTDEFITNPSRFIEDASLLFVLREWNSYTPTIPTEDERDRGGGYFLWHKGEGIVIDPGYDFIEAFHRTGGRLCDIHHIIITHAHDDHTAELEQLLMLLHRRVTWKDAAGNPLSPKPRRVSVYMNQGAERKFAGIIPLRGGKHIEKVVVLSKPTDGSVQKIMICEGVELTVLPAYHDDVVTLDSAVGRACLAWWLSGAGARSR